MMARPIPKIKKMVEELKEIGIYELYVEGGEILPLEECPKEQVLAAWYDHIKKRLGRIP